MRSLEGLTALAAPGNRLAGLPATLAWLTCLTDLDLDAHRYRERGVEGGREGCIEGEKEREGERERERDRERKKDVEGVGGSVWPRFSAAACEAHTRRSA